MNKKKLTAVIAAMLLSLFGLIGVQLYWIDAALRLNDEQFGHRVNEALSDMIRSMEEKESERLLAMHFEKKQEATSLADNNDTLEPSVHDNAPGVPVARMRPSTPSYQDDFPEDTNDEPSEHTATEADEPTEEADGDDVPTRDALKITRDNEDSIRAFPLLHLNGVRFFEEDIQPLTMTYHSQEEERSANRQRRSAAVTVQRPRIRIQTYQKEREVEQQVKELRRRDSSIQIIMRNKSKIIEDVIVQLCNSGMQVEQQESFDQEESFPANRSLSKNKTESMFRTIGYGTNYSPSTAANTSDKRITWNSSPRNRRSNTYTFTTEPTAILLNSDHYAQKNSIVFSSNEYLHMPSKAVTLTVAQKPLTARIHKPQHPHTTVKKVSAQTVAQKVNQVTDMTARWIAELATGPRPIQERLRSDSLDTLIRTTIKNSGIDVPFSYEVRHAKSGKVAFAHKALQSENNSNIYSATLFPNDILPSEYELRLYFHDNATSALEKIWKQLLASGIFLSIVVTTFGYTVMTMNRQKKLSDMKTEFINNMTHEFQTPISTISLASEALKDPDIAADEARRQRFAGIIYTENKRLGKHVELLLQAAQIENGTYSIVAEQVDIHSIIMNEAHNAAIQIEKRGGTLSTYLQASQSQLFGDATHISNVIRNLLDNAIKYSPETPDIRVETKSDGKYISIAVHDKGRGMTRDQASMVFERFYRVPTGNRHDVKGFGLGLSYVKAMVEAHDGTISVQSEPHKGSIFTIMLPLSSQISS